MMFTDQEQLAVERHSDSSNFLLKIESRRRKVREFRFCSSLRDSALVLRLNQRFFSYRLVNFL